MRSPAMAASWRETQSRSAYLARVFRKDTPPDLFNTLLARICVLYEDIKIEAHGAAADSIEALDILQPMKENVDTSANIGFYRKIYFIRRMIGTLHEFADALCKLHEEKSFQPTLDHMEPSIKEAWMDGIRYFKKEGPILKRVRDDVGGHFGIKAALFAVDNLPESATGRIEMSLSLKGREPHLYFASEIVSTAILRHLPGKDTKEKGKRFFDDHLFIADSHATTCVHIVTIEYLFRLFGQ
jgi:hypothetical protein